MRLFLCFVAMLSPILAKAITDTPAVQETRANFSRAFDDAQKGIIGAQYILYTPEVQKAREEFFKRYASVKCGDGWVLNPDNVSCYKILAEETDWFTAKENCAALNAHLVYIRSAQENKFVKELVMMQDGFLGFWMGGNDIDNEGTFQWTDGSPVTFTDWNNGEPNNDENDEDCLMGYRTNWKWNDNPCRARKPWEKLPAICQKL